MEMTVGISAWAVGNWLFSGWQISDLDPDDIVIFRVVDVVVLSMTMSIILSRPNITGGAAGVMIIFASGISDSVRAIIRNLRDYQVKGISIERTSEYRHIEPEDQEQLYDTHIESLSPSLQKWPKHGHVLFKDVNARYAADQPDILHDISFEISGGQRVGIVGATGCGKSTLAKTIFNFVDISQGSIEIDQIGMRVLQLEQTNLIKDIATIPLWYLRSKVGIIAQDPVLLSGTLRLNLDLDGNHMDEELYRVLRQVHLIGSGEDTLSANVDPSDSDSEVTIVNNSNIFTRLDSEITSGGQK